VPRLALGVIRLPEGLSARSATFDDVDAVTSLVAACELAIHGEADTNRSEIDGVWRQPSFDIAADSLLALEGDRVLAEAEVLHGRRAEVHVHPEARGRGIGTALLAWTEDRARAVGSKVLGQTVPDADPAAVELLKIHGYTKSWTSWVLEIHLRERPPTPDLPDGIEIRRFVPGRDEHDAHDTIEGSFDWPDRVPESFDDWAATTIGREDFEPWQMRLAVDGGEVVGAVLFGLYPDGGWVDQLAVRPPHRGRGLGRALLEQAFMACFDRGATRARLATHSRTDALGLYEHAGMHVTRWYAHFAREP
jgi:GNAT superfamily N-acetyltransferase